MTENHDRAIGRIEGKLDRLIEEQHRSTEKHGEMYRELEQVRKNQDDSTRQIAGIDARLGRVEKPVSDFNRWRERVAGAIMLICLAAAIVGSSAAVFWQKIIAIFK